MVLARAKLAILKGRIGYLKKIHLKRRKPGDRLFVLLKLKFSRSSFLRAAFSYWILSLQAASIFRNVSLGFMRPSSTQY